MSYLYDNVVATARELLKRNVTFWLREREWNQSRLSRESGVTTSQLSDVLRGGKGMSIEKVEDLARALNVPISALFVDRDQSRQTGSV